MSQVTCPTTELARLDSVPGTLLEVARAVRARAPAHASDRCHQAAGMLEDLSRRVAEGLECVNRLFTGLVFVEGEPVHDAAAAEADDATDPLGHA